ncbi:lytic murein transglycosylase [Aliiroseovarius lamellibrachiae]|uniref:lytic murein transglycosylase n=1 Tax=Aliiroseovarius lamellibrachiae TaxID=1924933 RepID=UPI001BE0B743|nr:lytic murein transglycosylase [Aliiroseovarius lamellibrachiae]MBT2131326.1 lytic murein transglycosylase [Aliiroseovarius lamellibrachiae]
MMDRRFFSASVAALVLSGCMGSTGGGGPQSSAKPVGRSRVAVVANPDFDRWLAGARGRAKARGISDKTLSRSFPTIGYLPDVIKTDRNQSEFKRSFEDYMAIATSESRVATGRAMLSKHAALFSKIEAKYGVEKEVVAAVWGLESRYGSRRGDIPTLSALATLAYDGRRGAFFEKQLIAALQIIQRGDISPARMNGSWAGAMGHTQFIPTSYQAFAVDFDGDGRRDIWDDDPTDALASAAAYLSRNGWVTGARWGRESAGGDIAPAGAEGPRFSAGPNYKVLGRYNNAQKYIIGVGILSDLLAGRGGLRHRFGPDANGMRLADRIRLQKALARAGYDVGEPDGVIGPKTIAAVRSFEQSRGLAVTGKPSIGLLAKL